MKKIIYGLILVLSSLCLGQAELRFYCGFDEIEGSIVKCGSIQGEIKGGKIVEGIKGNGFYFDGKEKNCECIILPDTRKDKFFQVFDDGPFSISVWIKPDSSKDYRKQQEILNTAGDIGPGWRLFYTWRMIVFRSGTGKRDETGKGIYWQLATNPAVDKVKNNEWNHIVVVRNKEGILSLWLNGKKAGESEKEFKITDANYQVTIGGYRSGYAYGFKGIIDEVKIYKGELNPEDILTEYKGKIEKKKNED